LRLHLALHFLSALHASDVRCPGDSPRFMPATLSEFWPGGLKRTCGFIFFLKAAGLPFVGFFWCFRAMGVIACQSCALPDPLAVRPFLFVYPSFLKAFFFLFLGVFRFCTSLLAEVRSDIRDRFCGPFFFRCRCIQLLSCFFLLYSPVTFYFFFSACYLRF